MKRVIIFALLLIAFNVSFSQYHRLIRENVYWDEEKYMFGSGGCFDLDSIKRIFFEGDTLINGQTYNKVFFYDFVSLNIDSFCPPFELSPVKNQFKNIFLREDTLEKKVFILNYGFDTLEYLLFDFSLSLGDTFVNQYEIFDELLIVSYIDSVLLQDSSIRKIYILEGMLTSMQYLQIEGVGSTVSLLHGYFGSNPRYSIRCVKEGGNPLWGYCETYFTSINEVNEYGVTIQPNPFCDFIQVNTNLSNFEIKIFNSFGELVYENQNMLSGNTISTNELPAGIYFVHILISGKIEKKTIIKV